MVRMLAATGLVFLATSFVEAQTPTPPNIVMIMADDLGSGDVGWRGGPFQTPNLDLLAKESARLEQHYSYPVCSPTRSALLTGRYASRFGCSTPMNPRVLPFDTVTLATALKSLGYQTALIGKWHLGSRPEWGPQHFGFDHSYGSLAGGVGPWTHRYKEGEFSHTWHRNGKLLEEEGHVTDLLTREAIRFLEMPRKGPFFLYVPYSAVHIPIDEPKQWLDRYPNEPDLAKKQYGACLTHLDDGVGQILKTLDKLGQRDNTLVLFLSDNGATPGTENNDTRYPGTYASFRIPGLNGLLRGKKAQVYEGGIRTPALVRWPGRIPAGKVEGPIHVADWMPTLAAVAGYKAKADLKWDGFDVRPLLEGKKPGVEPRTFYILGPGRQSRMLRHGNWVLIDQKGKAVELYDLASDPGQQQDQAAAQPQRVAQLQDLLRQQAARDDDALVKEN